MWIISTAVPLHTKPHLSYEIWGSFLTQAAIATSMTVNALMIGLIVFRIFKVFREVRAASRMSATSESTLRRIMFILIESGAALFFIQLVRLIIGSLVIWKNGSMDIRGPYDLIIGINQMLNVSIDKSDTSASYFADNVC